MTFVAPRIVNDVSSVMRINHEIHFAWQEQYLVKLDCDSCCSALCNHRLDNRRVDISREENSREEQS